MLVIAWEAMNDAIPRLQAEESLAAYTVGVVAAPSHDRQALDQRMRIIEAWQRIANGPIQRWRRGMEVTFATLESALRGAFDKEIR